MITSVFNSRSRRHTVRFVLTRVALLLALGAVCPVRAETPVPVPGADVSTKFKIDASDPERSVPTEAEAMKNPLEMGYLMMDLIARAEAATQAGDHVAAVRYYRALAKAVPARAVSFSKLCKSYEALGEREQALESCRAALGKGGVVLDDYVRFVRLSLKQTAPLDASQIEEVESVVSHVRGELKSDPQGPLVAALLACELATRLEDVARLQTCTTELTKIAPSDARTFAFRWALVLRERDWESGAAIIVSAAKAGIPAPAIQSMKSQLAAERDKPGAAMSLIRDWGLVGGLTLLCCFGLLFLARKKDDLRPA